MFLRKCAPELFEAGVSQLFLSFICTMSGYVHEGINIVFH